MYIRAETIIPISAALVGKGMGWARSSPSS